MYELNKYDQTGLDIKLNRRKYLNEPLYCYDESTYIEKVLNKVGICFKNFVLKHKPFPLNEALKYLLIVFTFYWLIDDLIPVVIWENKPYSLP